MPKRCLQNLAFLFLALLAGTAISQTRMRVLESSNKFLQIAWSADQAAQPPDYLAKPSFQSGQQVSRFASLLLLPPQGDVRIAATPQNLQSVNSDANVELSGFILPREFAELKEIGIWRGFRLARLQINPLIRDAANQVLEAQQVAVRVEFGNVLQNPKPSAMTASERQVMKSVLNAERASFWRMTAPPIDLKTIKTAAANSPYLRIEVSEAGMYRLSFEELLAVYGSLDSVDPAQIQIFDRENKIALHFDGDADALFEPGEALWFWTDRLSGENGEWFNASTDTKVLQLHLGQAAGRRFQQRMVRDSSTAVITPFFKESLHFEKDQIYYHGDDDADIFNSASIPGEGWIWATINASEQFVTALTLPAVAGDAPACSLRARIRGITRDAIKPNHHVQIYLNSQLLVERQFSDRDDLILRAAFAANVLRSGENALRVVSVGGTGAAIDLFYLDWIEIDCWRQFDAGGDQIAFRNNARDDARYQIKGLPNDRIFVFDLAAEDQLQGFEIEQGSDSSWSIRFFEQADADRHFLVVSPSNLKTVDHLEQVSPSGLRDPSSAADMLILTHADFRQQAERLAEHRRQHSGLRVVVIDVRELYDEFDFGHVSEQALRNFLSYVAQFWQKPMPQFVLLFGDASWDPKRNLRNSTKQNFVPTYGNPVSDSRLACIDGEDDFLPDYFIGRLAVETVEEAQEVVDKLIRYEQMPLQDWAKNFTFLNGGVNAFEQSLFLELSEELIRHYVEAKPMAGKSSRIYKSSDGRTEGELLPDILSAIDNGTSLMAFSGHAGSQTWELMMVNDDIDELKNIDRLPFIASMTCHTARFAEPLQSCFGEIFLRLPERGAAAFWGTSGWGFAYQDGILLKSLFKAVTEDTVRSLGVATLLAKLGLWQQEGGSQTNINLIDQYTLLGDPALALQLPKQPDLAILPNNLTCTPANPTEQDSLVLLEVTVRNRGLATVDSTSLQVTARQLETSVPHFSQAAQIGAVGYAETATFAWRNGSRLGDFLIDAQIDGQNNILEADEQNNSAQVLLHFAASGLTIASPRLMEVTSKAQPVLAVYNADILSTGQRSYSFEIDTSMGFSSEFLLQSPALAEAEVRTIWQAPIALQDGRYYWRARAETDSVTDTWQVSSFYIDVSTSQNGFLQQGEDWRQSAGSFSRDGRGAMLPRQSSNQLFEPSGEVYSPAIGPAFAWHALTILQDIVMLDEAGEASKAEAQFALWGRKHISDDWQLLENNVATEASLADIDAEKYPFLQLRASFKTRDARVSPLLQSWRADFEPMGDIVLPKASLHLQSDSLLQGTPLQIAASAYFFGEHAPDSVMVLLSQQTAQNSREPVLSKRVAFASGKADVEFEWLVELAGTSSYFISADPGDEVPESVQYNNTISFERTILQDMHPPRLEILLDGRPSAAAPSYVSPRPELICAIFDDNPFAIRDTSQIRILIDGRQILFNDPDAKPEFRLLSDGDKRAEVVLYPVLSPGSHIILAQVEDVFGNRAETSINVNVASDLELLDVLNYPNPFANETQFTFTLTQLADEVRIKIFTVAGRLIQTIEMYDAAAGFNAIPWNGIDADGDALANGIYLYKVIARHGQRQVEKIAKLAIAR